jgi:hypothetical protein
LDEEVGGLDVARRLRQVRGDLVGQDALAGALHSVFKVLELFRLSSLQFGRLAAQVLQPVLIGGNPQRSKIIFVEKIEMIGVGRAGAPDGLKLSDGGHYRKS